MDCTMPTAILTTAKNFLTIMKLNISQRYEQGREQVNRVINHWKTHISSGRHDYFRTAQAQGLVILSTSQKSQQQSLHSGKSSQQSPISIKSALVQRPIKHLSDYCQLSPLNSSIPATKFKPCVYPSFGNSLAKFLSTFLNASLTSGLLNQGMSGYVLSMSLSICAKTG